MAKIPFTANFFEYEDTDYPSPVSGVTHVVDEGVTHLVAFADDDIPFEAGETRPYFRRCVDDVFAEARPGVIVLDGKVDCLACLIEPEPHALRFAGTVTGRMSCKGPPLR